MMLKKLKIMKKQKKSTNWSVRVYFKKINSYSEDFKSTRDNLLKPRKDKI